MNSAVTRFIVDLAGVAQTWELYRGTMQIILNGKDHSVDDGATVADMLQDLQIEPIRVAVEINEDIVSRKTFTQTRLREGDRVEIVTFVGGGSW